MAGSKSSRGGKGGSQTSTGPSMALVPYQPQTTTAQQPTANLTDDQIIANALGTQGKGASVKEAIERVNPNFSTMQHEWTHNCQRCVWAAEMQRRGYDVEAMPRTKDDSYAKADTSYANSFLNDAEGGIDLHVVQSPFNKESAADFKAHFTDKYDVGARGMIVAYGKGGHVFNWEVEKYKGGKRVRFYDTQPNGTRKGLDNRSVTSMQKRWNIFFEGRMDNVKVTPLIKDFVKRRGT